jgi:hypothetical protein
MRIIRRYGFLYLISFIVLIGLAQCTGSLDSQLKARTRAENKNYPHLLDQYTRVDSCTTYGTTYKYFLTLSDIMITDTTLFKVDMTPQIIKTAKINPKMVFFKKNDITLEYQYSDKDGKYICTIIIKPDEYK